MALYFPTPTVQFAPSSAALAAVPAYEPILSPILSINVNGGRNYLLDLIQATKMKIRFLNIDGVLDPNNPDSPWWDSALGRTKLRPGKKIQLIWDYLGTKYTMFTGYITGYPRTYPSVGWGDEVEITAVDIFRRLNRHRLSMIFTQDMSGNQIRAMADAVGIPGNGLNFLPGHRYIQTGTFPMQEIEIERAPALERAQHISEGEEGLFYQAPDGELTWISSDSLLQPPYSTPQAVFGGAGNIAFTDVEPSLDDDLVFNDFIGSIAGGDEIEIEDEDSIEEFGRSTLQRMSMPLMTNNQLRDLLTHLRLTHSQPQYRIRSIEVRPDHEGVDDSHELQAWPVILNHRLGYAEQINKKELSGYTTVQRTNLQHFNHDISYRGRKAWASTFQMSLMDPYIEEYWDLNLDILNQGTRWGR